MPASVSATYSSTVAEELVALLRRLHALEAWNPLINEFISERLSRVVTMATPRPMDNAEYNPVWSLCWPFPVGLFDFLYKQL